MELSGVMTSEIKESVEQGRGTASEGLRCFMETVTAMTENRGANAAEVFTNLQTNKDGLTGRLKAGFDAFQEYIFPEGQPSDEKSSGVQALGLDELADRNGRGPGLACLETTGGRMRFSYVSRPDGSLRVALAGNGDPGGEKLQLDAMYARMKGLFDESNPRLSFDPANWAVTIKKA